MFNRKRLIAVAIYLLLVYVLEGLLNKPYIKIEKPGIPSKWVMIYAPLAEKERA